MKRPDARMIVLARRAKFVSAALAGTLACGKSTAPPDEHTPRVCLSAAPLDPRPCLSVAMPKPPAEDAGAADGGKLVPMPCLKVAVPPGSKPVDAHPDCGVPYTIDAQGLKRYKPECL